MWKVTLYLLLAMAASYVAEDKPERVEPDVAARNLTKRVDPAIPPLAKAVGIGGTVIADVVIDSSGKIRAVTLVSGHPMLAPAFIDAVKKWEYTPFLKDGRPISVVTRVEWAVASPKYSHAQESALRDYYPTFRNCYGLLK
jgi:protein TonB